MLAPHKTAIALAAGALASCSSVPPARSFAPVPNVPLLSARPVPAPAQDQAVITLKQEIPPVDPDQIATRGAIKANPSVVIHVPPDRVSVATTGPRAATDVRTSAQYNRAEVEIAKSLIKAGFRVLDRAKFEAKVRDLREKKLNALVESARAARTLAEASAKKEREAGKLTEAEYELRMARIIKDQPLVPDRPPKLLVSDMVELLRACENGPVTADYIFQIDSFDIGESGERTVRIDTRPEVVEFLQRNPGIEIPESVTQPFWEARIAAKLIDVATGEIVWIGAYQAESLAAIKGGFRISLECTRTVVNGAEVTAAIADHNKRISAATAECNAARQAFIRGWEAGEHDRIAELENAFNESANRLEQLQTPPPAATAPWKYEYDLKTEIDPDLSKQSTPREQARKLEHDLDLLTLVARTLIATIEISK